MKTVELEYLRANYPSLVKLKSIGPGKRALEIRRWLIAQEAKIRPLDELRNDLIKKYGTEKDGSVSIENGTPEMHRFVDEYQDAAKEKIDLEDLQITDTELEDLQVSGWDIDVYSALGLIS